MRGRDNSEHHRATTPLELLFDLTFAVAFGVAGAQFAHLITQGHVLAGLLSFGLAMFAIVWAWINFSWFSSAFDTDDWLYRVTTMVQMIGVIILTLGLPPMFASIEAGGAVDNTLMVAGYIVMRLAMVFQWLRVARTDPEHRQVAKIYAVSLVIAQVGWVMLMLAHVTVWFNLGFACLLLLVEMIGPTLGERKREGTPWHAHHMAERYQGLAIITLGEGVIGTVATLSAVVSRQGWSVDAVLIAVAGTGLTFGLWWVYYIVPSGDILHRFRNRSFVWGYGHIMLFGALAAVGAGLHTAAAYIEKESTIGELGTVLALAIPVALFTLGVFLIYRYLVRKKNGFHVMLLIGTFVVLLLAVLLAALGLSMAWCLIVVMLAPFVTVLGFETVGHPYMARDIAEELTKGRSESLDG